MIQLFFFLCLKTPGIQEFVEGEIHFDAHGTSFLSDQLAVVPERVAELEGLTEPVRKENGIQVVDTQRFFKGDKPCCWLCLFSFLLCRFFTCS